MQMIWERQEKEGMFCFRKGLILELFKAFRRITFFLLFFSKQFFHYRNREHFLSQGSFDDSTTRKAIKYQADTSLLTFPQSISAPEKDMQKESSMMPLTVFMQNYQHLTCPSAVLMYKTIFIDYDAVYPPPNPL